MINDVVVHFDEGFPAWYEVDPEADYRGADLSIWRNGRILAVVRRGPDGKPQITRFEA